MIRRQAVVRYTSARRGAVGRTVPDRQTVRDLLVVKADFACIPSLAGLCSETYNPVLKTNNRCCGPQTAESRCFAVLTSLQEGFKVFPFFISFLIFIFIFSFELDALQEFKFATWRSHNSGPFALTVLSM